MPATSEKQKRFMDAAAHNKSFAKKVGVPQSVAKEYSEKSEGFKFKEGGAMDTGIRKGRARFGDDIRERAKKYVAGQQEKKSTPAPAKKQSFKEAFAAARKAGKGEFTWNGKPYSTAMKGEGKKPTKTAPKTESQSDIIAKQMAGGADKPAKSQADQIKEDTAKIAQAQMAARRQEAQSDKIAEQMGAMSSARRPKPGRGQTLPVTAYSSTDPDKAAQARKESFEKKGPLGDLMDMFRSDRSKTSTGGQMNRKKAGGKVKMASGGSVSKRADGCAQRGKTKGKMR